jgi:hypothetical protein
MRAKFRVVTSVLKVEQKFSMAQNIGMSYWRRATIRLFA